MNGAAQRLVAAIYEAFGHFIGFGQFNELRHGDDRLNVRLLDHALMNFHIRRLDGLSGGNIKPACLMLHCLIVWKAHRAEATKIALAVAYGAVLQDLNSGNIVGKLDRAAACVEDRCAIQRHKRSRRIETEPPVAGIARAARCLNLQPAIAAQCNIERISRLLIVAGAHVGIGEAVEHKGHLAAVLRALHMRIEKRRLPAKADRVHVGDVIRHHIELMLQCELPRKADINLRLHALAAFPCTLNAGLTCAAQFKREFRFHGHSSGGGMRIGRHLLAKSLLAIGLAAGGASVCAPAAAQAISPPPAGQTGNGDFLEVRRSHEARAASNDAAIRAKALADLIELHLQHGFYKEAYGYAVHAAKAAPDALAGPRGHDLSRIAVILARIPPDKDETGTANVKLADPDAELLWQLAAAAMSGKPIPDGMALPSDAAAVIGDLRHYPVPIQRDLAPELLDAALRGGDTDFIRAVTRRLGELTRNDLSDACRRWVSGRLAELEGYPKTALAHYGKVTEITDRCAAQATLHWVLRTLTNGRGKELEPAKERIDTLLRAWRGDIIEAQALRIAAAIEKTRGRPGAALTYLRALAERFPDEMKQETVRLEAEFLAHKLLSEGLEGRPLNALRKERKDYMRFLATPAERRDADKAFARALIAAGRADEAAGIYHTLAASAAAMPGTKEDAGEQTALLESEAETLVKAGRHADALAAFARLPDAASPKKWSGERRRAYLAALIGTGRLDEAKDALLPLLDGQARIALARAYMRLENWETAYAILDGTLKETPPAEVTSEACDALAAAALLSGHAAGAAAFLAAHRGIWDGRSPVAAMVLEEAAGAETSTGPENDPENEMAATLAQTGTLIRLATELGMRDATGRP